MAQKLSVSCFSVLSAFVAALALAAPAHAQISSPFVPTSESQEEGQRPRNSSIQLFPLAVFSGTDTRLDLTNTLTGIIIAAETGKPLGDGRRSYKFGGFAFLNNGDALFEGHAKYYFTPQWGVQLGMLTSSNNSGIDVDGFVMYNITPKKATRLWSVQLGAGSYYINNVEAHRFTGYVQGSYEVAKGLTLDASYWYINTPTGYFNRFVLGVGRRF